MSTNGEDPHHSPSQGGRHYVGATAPTSRQTPEFTDAASRPVTCISTNIPVAEERYEQWLTGDRAEEV